MTAEANLKAFNRLVGKWTTEATHPAMPGVVVRGTVVTEWLEGERFLIQRSRNDHPDFPDAVTIIGSTERDRVGDAPANPNAKSPTMHYFDSRGVFRVYESSIEPAAWKLWREAPGFSQRFTGTFQDNDHTISGLWQLREDDTHWTDDLRITYRRV